MLRMSAMDGLDRTGGIRLARLAAVLIGLAVSGCSSPSGSPDPTVDTPWTSRFTGMFSGSGSPPPAQAAAAAGVPGDDCPQIDIRDGAETYTVQGDPTQASVTGVRYQASLSQVARQCTVAGGTLTVRIGVQGRIILGPAGGPGQVDLPIRYAVVQEGPAPRTIATKFKHVPADVPSDKSYVVFSDVDDSLSFPMPARADLAAYMVYVGFDEVGDVTEKKPAPKKPAAKRKSG